MLITAGPTREHLDPVRFMTNASSGAMGFALAKAARAKGARVTVVSGPAALRPPRGVTIVPVESALEMRRAVMARWRDSDVVIGAAAVGDWRFARPSSSKIKRSARALRLTMIPNPDIIAEVARRAKRDARRPRALGQGPRPGARRCAVVGFALETTRWLSHAREKLERKGLDLVVANRTDALASKRSRAALVSREATLVLPLMDKERLAGRILAAVEEIE